MRATMGVMILGLVCSCADAETYGGCETAGDCTEIRGDGTSRCLVIADAQVCTWSCETDDDCVADDDVTRQCAPPPEGVTELGSTCLPSCRDDGASGSTSCPEGYACQARGDGEGARRACYPDAE